MDRWRDFFEGAGTDICTIIENAIAVAASDCPQELMVRRDRIAQRLFACGFVRCGQCSALTLAGPDSFSEGDNIKGGVILPRCEGQHNHAKGSRDDGSPTNKGTSSSNEVERNKASNYSYDEAEALTEEIEEESEVIREVDRIKGILSNPDESEKQLYESLRRLELMQLSVDTLEVTAIGKVVSRLRRHNSERIRSMAKMLVSGWKELVDVWMKTTGSLTAAAIGTSPDSVSPEDFKDDENGLPSPPLDEGAFLTTQTASIEMSEFFDGMDDDGNPRITDEHDNDSDDDDKQHYSRKQSVQQSNLMRVSETTVKQVTSAGNKEKGNITSGGNKEKGGIASGGNKGKGVIKPGIQNQKNTDCHKSSINASTCPIGSSAPVRKSSGIPQPNEYRGIVHRLTDSTRNQTRPSTVQLENKSQSLHDISVRGRVEAAKRKLQEGYQQAEK
ncbi:hypothetical protein KI387_004592, partial [Taxus chinensis]